MKTQKSETERPNDETVYHPYLEAENIYLREVRISDVNEDYYSWLNDIEVTRFLETRFAPQSMQSIAEYVQRYTEQQKDSIFLAIIEKKSNLHIGNIKVGPINWYHRFADVSIIIGRKESWGKNYATEAIKTVTEYSFKTLNLHRLSAYIYNDNIASTKAFLKSGFKQEGVCYRKRFSEGQYVDEKIYGIVNE